MQIEYHYGRYRLHLKPHEHDTLVRVLENDISCNGDDWRSTQEMAETLLLLRHGVSLAPENLVTLTISATAQLTMLEERACSEQDLEQVFWLGELERALRKVCFVS